MIFISSIFSTFLTCSVRLSQSAGKIEVNRLASLGVTSNVFTYDYRSLLKTRSSTITRDEVGEMFHGIYVVIVILSTTQGILVIRSEREGVYLGAASQIHSSPAQDVVGTAS